MERRLILHEKLKASKQKKMTIKQGDVLVTLNLKTDLANPDIEIADKALFMLEAFAEKLTPTELPKIGPPTAIDDTIGQSPQTKPISRFKSKEKLLSSASKRVRFDLEPGCKEMNIVSDIEVVASTSQEKTHVGLVSIPSEPKESADSISTTLLDSITSTPLNNTGQSKEETTSVSKPSKKRIQDYFKTKESSQTVLENDISGEDLDEGTSHVEVINRDEEKDATKDLYPVFNFKANVSKISSGSSSNNTSTNSSNNTLDELLEELDKSNSKLIQETDKVREEMQIEKSPEPEIPFAESTVHETADVSDFSQPIEATPHEASFSYIKHCELADANNSEVFKCRLCHLKLNNQRALHEHVARIHGGKAGLFNSSLFSSTTLDDSEQDNFETEDSDMDMMGKFDKKFKKKSHCDYMPHPNVAIRVAKIAYYNSKITNSSATSGGAFKANIFTSGMRGNFFSQERLPLRSCKIKMKLKRRQNSTESANSFLTSVNSLTSFQSLDRNTTLTVQNSRLNDGEHLSDAAIRKFFKKLLVYVPINSAIRINELIQSNEALLVHDKEDHKESLRIIFELILDSKQIGITLATLKRLFDAKISTLKNRMLKFISLLQILLDNFLILSVGVVSRVYVAHQFKQHWVIQSFKNQKGRGFGLFDKTDEKSDSSSDTENDPNDQSILSSEETTDSANQPRSSLRIKSNTCNSIIDDKSAKQFKSVCLVPRPWRYIDGLLNRPVLQKMLETVIIHLKTYPNSSLENIANHFCPVLQPIMTLELLEILEELRVVVKTVLRKEEDCTLFSDFQNGAIKLDDLDLARGDEIYTYCCTQNAIFTIKTLFAK